MIGRLRLPRWDRIGLVAAVTATACGGATASRGGAWSGARPTPGELATTTVAVLPAGAVHLPEGVMAVTRDSLLPALATYTGSILATALEAGGVVGRGLGPDAIAAPLVALGDRRLLEAHEGLDRAEPLTESRGRLDPEAGDAFTALSDAAGRRFVLVPRRIDFERVEIMEWRARLLVYLVDAGAGRVTWRAEALGDDPLPPTGRSPDLLLAALERSARAAAESVAERLRRPGGDDPDPFDERTPD